MAELFDPEKAKMRYDRMKLLERHDPVAFARAVNAKGKDENKLYNPNSVEYAQSHVSHPEPEI